MKGFKTKLVQRYDRACNRYSPPESGPGEGPESRKISNSDQNETCSEQFTLLFITRRA